MSKKNFAEAFEKYQRAAREAVQFTNANWTADAITREQHARLQAARGELKQAVGTTGEQSTVDLEAARQAAFDKVATQDANSVAVAQNEWIKVSTLLAAGRNLAHIIDGADTRRLSAILDHLESDLAAQSDDPEGVAAEVSQAVLVRLAALGVQEAREALAAQADVRHEDAWHRVIGEALRGPVSVDARTDLYRADSDEFRAAFDPDDLEAAGVDESVKRLGDLQMASAEDASA